MLIEFASVVEAVRCASEIQDGAAVFNHDGEIDRRLRLRIGVNVGDIVHFAENSSALSGEAQGILRNQARWLNQYPQYTITVEGHADERGTREYNLALGARRATAVKSFLGQTGVNPGRIRTVSYGKERPVATCDAPTCWNQNRRAQTVLNDRGGAIARNY